MRNMADKMGEIIHLVSSMAANYSPNESEDGDWNAYGNNAVIAMVAGSARRDPATGSLLDDVIVEAYAGQQQAAPRVVEE